MMFSKKAAAGIWSKGLDYFDGYSVLTYFRSTYDSNFFFVQNSDIDKALDQIPGDMDPDKRPSSTGTCR